MNSGLDQAFAAAIVDTAGAIQRHPVKHAFLEQLVVDALVAELQRRLRALVVEANRKQTIPDWKPQPGGVDVVARSPDGRLVAVAELKVEKTGETLWDIFKLAALAAAADGPTAFVVVAARKATWASERNECAALFAGPIGLSRSFASADLFRHYRRSWELLLAGGRGRPTRVPARVELTPVAAAPIPAFSGYELRGLQIRPAAGWVEFSGDWPVGMTPPPPPPPPLLDVDCAGYAVPARFSSYLSIRDRGAGHRTWEDHQEQEQAAF